MKVGWNRNPLISLWETRFPGGEVVSGRVPSCGVYQSRRLEACGGRPKHQITPNMNQIKRWIVTTFLAGAFASIAAPAQSFTIDSVRIGVNTSTSSGGAFSVDGGVSTTLSGNQLQGGDFAVEGASFQPGVSVSFPGGPTLMIGLVGSQISISWIPSTTDFVLEMSDNLTTGSWRSAPPGNPASLTSSGSARFFRLRRP